VATRSETAAATRKSLLEAAGALLDAGGPEAVTLREVGARAGVSRSAPYRHFTDKEALLTVLATNAVSGLGDTLEELANSDEPPDRTLRAALLSLVSIGRTRPHLYRLMFTTPSGDPNNTTFLSFQYQGRIPVWTPVLSQAQPKVVLGVDVTIGATTWKAGITVQYAALGSTQYTVTITDGAIVDDRGLYQLSGTLLGIFPIG